MATKRKAAAISGGLEDEDPVDPSDELTFIGLGGCQEVGRSCHILQYKGKIVMLDAGMHTGREGMAAMPYFDDFDLGTVDILLISQYVHITPSLLYLSESKKQTDSTFWNCNEIDCCGEQGLVTFEYSRSIVGSCCTIVQRNTIQFHQSPPS